jgi:endoglucanase
VRLERRTPDDSAASLVRPEIPKPMPSYSNALRHCTLLALATASSIALAEPLTLNEKGYFEKRGLNVLVFNNTYDGLFSDAKISSVELIHHGVRTATNGDVRLSPTPGQWDPAPRIVARRIDNAQGVIETDLEYPDANFRFTVQVRAADEGVTISVLLPAAVPANLEGRAGLNLEFLPSAYFHRGYLMDGKPGVFPLHPSGPMKKLPDGTIDPKPLATGSSLVLAPEDPERRVTVAAQEGALELFDGRNLAQNGWFVVRSILPAGKTGKVVEWKLAAHTIRDWVRTPVIAYSQLGYHPAQPKVAVIEVDTNATSAKQARLLRIGGDGTEKEVLAAEARPWGKYLRYHYDTFDFSAVREPGLYVIEYAGLRSSVFQIAENLFESAWHLTNDVYLPVQMDHMFVNEAYRVWHGDPHRDDARQAPTNHVHFDLYAQGPSTDSPFAPGEHIPGLNVGGWLDAGDFDLRTQTNYAVVATLVQTWERFRPTRDETTIDQQRRHVEIHQPDGIPDILQQIEHGTLQLLAQHKAVGHAIGGIVEPDLGQYTHLGDAASKTDNLIYNPQLKPGESDGKTSGTPDDRWAFTTKTTPLNYGSIAALSAASRALRGYRDSLAEECLKTAVRVWDEEHRQAPAIFQHGNTTGGPLEDEELEAAVELLLTTKDPKYAARVEELWSAIEKNYIGNLPHAVRALPFTSTDFARKLEARTVKFAQELQDLQRQNPYGVPISTGGWAGSGLVTAHGIACYLAHTAFPEIVPKDAAYKALNYLLGCHPGSNISLVSGVGTISKEVAYGSNRADFSFIPGGVVPGVLILKPDFPENKEDWPFLWGENEYVVNGGSSYIYLVHAVNDLVQRQ